ncbi:uncharacterized protein YmfQ-like [Ylistrum balloti]|uniref:uncharacterized protein YmfQ-like n=1 Tax=Ylistrum balloti TaxID=509963 RepID=UPI002905DAF6|nr:uncharacterized protein YmfQ-like [Ylistrum balloti]
MSSTTSQYRSVLLKLLPRGDAWAKFRGSRLYQFCEGLAGEFVRVHNRALKLWNELPFNEPTHTLADWESAMKLPDACLSIAPTIQERQAAVRARFSAVGAISQGYLIDQAEKLGFTTTLERFDPDRARCGTARCGTAVCSKSDQVRVLRLVITAGSNALDILRCHIDSIKRPSILIVYDDRRGG